MKKIKLIYILGSGHCGSTLLDLIIGSSPEVFSTGELAFYDIYRNKKPYHHDHTDYICTCEKAFNKCPFWKKINKKSNFHQKKIFSLTESIKIIVSILFSGYNYTIKDDSFKLIEQIFKEATKLNSNVEYILDSSKDPRRLYLLLSDSRLEVYPVLIIRNGVKVAKSYSRASKKDNRSKKKGFVPSFIVRWFLVNKLSKILIKNNKNAIYIKYENFCESTQKYIMKLNNELDLNISEKVNKLLVDINNKTYHNIDGNNLRFKKIKEIKKQ